MPTIPAGSSTLEGADGPSINRAYSSNNQNAASSIPVYVVGAQVLDYNPPNTQDNAAGAMPINLTSLEVFPDAIPIRIVEAAGNDICGSDQGNDLNAIPVFYSDRWDAIPCWNAGITGFSTAPSAGVLSLVGETPLRT